MLNATCNQMNAPCEQLRSKKVPHCAWSIQRNVGHVLRISEKIPLQLLLYTSGQVEGSWVGSRVKIMS